jgi:sec-independent protein translocase protein TatA
MLPNIGITEGLILLFIVLLLFGAKRLPEIGGSLGKGIREFKSSVKEVSSGVRAELEDSGSETTQTNEPARQPEPAQNDSDNS